jgi:hypothetical protein
MRKAAGAAGQVQAISINYTTRTWGEMNLGGGSELRKHVSLTWPDLVFSVP